MREYILFCGKRRPADLGARGVSAFISHLAVECRVAASTRTQALSALLFLYREVLALPIGRVDDVERAKKPKRLPVVFTREEVRAVLGHPREEAWLIASPLYGSWLRLMECVRLRVKDVNLDRLSIMVRDGKGGEGRVTVLPASLVEPLGRQLERARALHELDLRDGFGQVYLPYALAKKYPAADREWWWQYVSPARHRSVDPRSGREQRHRVAETACRKHSSGRSARPGWPGPGAVTPSATPSPHT